GLSVMCRVPAPLLPLRAPHRAHIYPLSLHDALPISDIITTCTRARAPLVKGANLKPGTHLDLVGGFTPDTRESDDEAAQRSRILDRKSTRLNSSHVKSSYAVFCLKKKSPVDRVAIAA